jgi:chorismate mutase/prephenate dehydratase
MELEKLRKQIDEIDADIVSLLNRRYSCVQKIGQWKKSQSHAIYVPEREKRLLTRLEKLNKGPMSMKTLRAVYREIMSGAIALEHPVNIAYFGAPATFTHMAAMAKFGHSVNYTPRNDIADIFADVDAERFDYGCVPIENSTEGAVNHTLDMFMNAPSDVKICAEINMRIHLNLLSKAKDISAVKKVYSHPQPLAQCKCWLRETLPHTEQIEVGNTSMASELATKEKSAAAIGTRLASEIYGLNITAENIEDSSDNTTRFFVIGKQDPAATGEDKTSVCFAVKDRVGALYECLLPFKDEKITLTMIESRPSKQKNWEYYFFVDLLGHITDASVARAVGKLDSMCKFLRVLGSYPRSKHLV